VILIAQIDQHIADGEHPWEAVISATEHRLRPILLTAAAASLGMIPIAPTVSGGRWLRRDGGWWWPRC
jgi:multidrug efflux pump subunit AcrB